MKASVIYSLLVPLLVAAGPALASFAGGDGSRADPWQIATAEQLDEIRSDLAAHYILTADVDLALATGDPSGAFWHDGDGWEPIGTTLGDSFTGSIDGNGFKIMGLFIDRAGKEQAGLFGWISFGAVVTGLALESVNITGHSLVGPLVVTNFGGTIENSYVTGSVNGFDFVGGLVGRNLSGTVENSYFIGNVSGNNHVGSLAGSNWATVKSNYAAGTVSGRDNVGGLIGVSSSQVQSSYWNAEISGLQNSSGGGTGLNSEQMRRQNSFRGFNFTAIWHIQESSAYPVLVNNPQTPAPGNTRPVSGGVADDTHTIRSLQHIEQLSGTIIVTATGVINGGSVTGTIRNLGVLAGRLSVGSGSEIRGGTVSGEITGTAAGPVLISGATVIGGAYLRNAVISETTLLDPDVVLGPNVRFQSAASLPPDLELTGALTALSWANGDGRSIPDLAEDVLLYDGETFPESILDSIRLPEKFAHFSIRQDVHQGEVSVYDDDARATVLPYLVRMAPPDSAASAFFDEDGNIVFITANQRAVSMYPVLADNAFFRSELNTLGISVQYGENSTLRLVNNDDSTVDADYLAARADFVALRAAPDLAAGVFIRNVTGLPVVQEIHMVYSDENGILMQQNLVPVPADWPAVKNTLTAIVGNSLKLDDQGVMTMEFAGQTIRGRMAFEVTAGASDSEIPQQEVRFTLAGDVNGDGTRDVLVEYPSGAAQTLYILP